MRELSEIQVDLKKSPLIISVVGHTNTGKTSIIRTLSGNEKFGVTGDGAGVTKKPESEAIAPMGLELWQCHDTPGFEMAQQAVKELTRHVEFDELIRFLKDEGEKLKLEHLAFQNVEKASLILYVINVTTDPLERHADELLLLGRSGIPIIPIFNWCKKAEKGLRKWKDFLKKQKLHKFVEFDCFENTIDDKINLFDAALHVASEPVQREALQWQIKKWENQKVQSETNASRAIATLVQRVMSYRPSLTSSKANEGAVTASLLKTWREFIREFEWDTFIAIGSFYDFKEHKKFIKSNTKFCEGKGSWEPSWLAWLNPLGTEAEKMGTVNATPTEDDIVSIVCRCLFVWAEVEKLGRAAIGRDECMSMTEQHYCVDLENSESYWQGTPQNLVRKKISSFIQDLRLRKRGFYPDKDAVEQQFPDGCNNKENQELGKKLLDELRPNACVNNS